MGVLKMSARKKSSISGRKGYLLFPLLVFLIGFLIPVASVSYSVAQEPLGWYEQDSGTTVSLTSVAAVDTMTAWAVGAEGTVLKTADGGASWLPQTSGTSLTLEDICAVDANTAWIIGSGGIATREYVVLRTTNGGTTWNTIVSGAGFLLTDITAVDAMTAWVAGAEGIISKTADGGTSWAIQPTGTTHAIRDIKAVDADHLWAVGGTGDPTWYIDGGVILKTDNGGNSWSARTEQYYLWRAISAADADTAWAVGSHQTFNGFPPMTVGVCRKTSDGGATWNDLIGSSTAYGVDVEAADALSVWEVGYAGYGSEPISKTTNGGITWSNPQYYAASILNGISAADPDHAWAVGATGTILHTTDGGWTQPAPHIDSISPTYCGSSSVVPVQVTITGANFGDGGMYGGSYKIRFGSGIILAPDSWNDTEIVFTLNFYSGSPYYGQSGEYEVSVTTDTGGTSNIVFFTLVSTLDPVISSVSPPSGMVEDEITISGINFGEADISSRVIFGATFAEYESWSDTSIVCSVPSGVYGIAPIVVATGGGTSEPVDFTVLPHIDGISPSEGTAGTEVTITGSALTEGRACIDGVQQDYMQHTYFSDSEIRFKLPALPAGDKTITVASPVASSNGATINILPVPAISGIEPMFTSIGSETTISGYSFGSERGDSYVSFGDVQVSDYLGWSDTSIVCRVPDGVPSSWGSVTVTTPEGTSYEHDFFVMAKLRGRVTDAISGQPIEGIYVCLFYYNQNPTQIVYYRQTDSNGEYLFETVEPVPYRIGFTDLSGKYQFEFYDEQLEFDLAQSVNLYPSPNMVIDEDLSPLLSISAINPSSGIENTAVGATVSGNLFQPGTTVRLENSATGTSIAATDVAFVSTKQITCNLNLQGAPLGTYDVVVTNPDGKEARLVGGFKVTNICGQGANVAVLMLGLTLGLLSLAGSSRLRKRKKRA